MSFISLALAETNSASDITPWGSAPRTQTARPHIEQAGERRQR